MLCIFTAVAVWYLPARHERQAQDRLRLRTEKIATVLADSYGSGLVAHDADLNTRAAGSIALLDEVEFAVVTSTAGEMVSILRSLDSDSVRTAEVALSPAQFSSRGLVVSVPIGGAASGGGSLILGVSKAEFLLEVRERRLLYYGFGALLLLIAFTIVVSAARNRKMHASLKTRHDELSVEFEEQQNLEIKYKELYEEAMQAIHVRDMEERQREEELRHQAISGPGDGPVGDYSHMDQEALTRYTRRMEALNDLALAALRSVHQEVIVAKALDHLAELVDYDFAQVVEFDHWKGEGRVLGIQKDPGVEIPDVGHMPISYFRAGDKTDRFQKYLQDLITIAHPADLEQDFLAAGLRSYYRQSLMIGDQTLGVMMVASREANAYKETDLKAGRDVVDVMSLAISVHRHNDERDRYEAELIAAKDRAEEMARLKTAFLSNMSHEIRTPLSGMIGFAQVLEQELEGEMHEFATLISKGAKRLLDTINSVLDFAKLEAGQLSMVSTTTDVNETIRDAVKLLRPLAVQKDLQLELKLTDEAIQCTLDSASLERIINNLVGNAIKFTDEGYVEITTEILGEFGRMVVLDTGSGISEELMPNLFNEFHQGEMGEDREHEGSGLGLAITRHLVDKMGGWIEVDNREVRGAVFAITFPLVLPEEEEPEKKSGINSVLVVSESEDINFADYAKLQHEMELQTAPDLKAAVQHARHRRYDLVVVKMQDKDPETELTRVRAVRDIPDYASVPFIAVSDKPFTEQDQLFLQSDFDGFYHEAHSVSAYLFQLAEQNRRIAEMAADSDVEETLEPKWEDDDPYGEDYDTSHLFGDDKEPVWDPDQPDFTP